MQDKKIPVLPSVSKILTEFGENIKLARLRRKLSAEQVAERACYEEEYKAGDWVVGWYCELKEGYHKNAWQIDRITGDYAYVKGTNHNTRVSNIKRKATQEEIKKAIVIEIGGKEAFVIKGNIAFGCQSFTKAELEAYLRLFNENINAKLTIHNVEITKELIQKLINKLN